LCAAQSKVQKNYRFGIDRANRFGKLSPNAAPTPPRPGALRQRETEMATHGLDCNNWRRSLSERFALETGARLPYWIALVATVAFGLSVAGVR